MQCFLVIIIAADTVTYVRLRGMAFTPHSSILTRHPIKLKFRGNQIII